MADQSILKSAVPPASPMPLFISVQVPPVALLGSSSSLCCQFVLEVHAVVYLFVPSINPLSIQKICDSLAAEPRDLVLCGVVQGGQAGYFYLHQNSVFALPPFQRFCMLLV